jgi:hypothetical protein
LSVRDCLSHLAKGWATSNKGNMKKKQIERIDLVFIVLVYL